MDIQYCTVQYIRLAIYDTVHGVLYRYVVFSPSPLYCTYYRTTNRYNHLSHYPPLHFLLFLVASGVSPSLFSRVVLSCRSPFSPSPLYARG
jgi:hypothetical protein